MNVRSLNLWDTKYGVTQYFRFTIDKFFVLDFFIKFWCVYDWKNYCTVLVICVHKQVKSIVFGVAIKFCDESGLAILSFCIKDSVFFN